MKIREGFVESGGHRLACLAVNEHLANDDEPAVVFIHGVLASVNFWRDCVPPGFREGRAWYALSLPAHHPSTVPDDFKPGDVDDAWFYRVMRGALEALVGDRQVIVVGHSTGGFCALDLAIHGAPNVVGVVSIAGFYQGQWGGVEGLLLKIAGLGRWAKGLFVSNIVISQWSAFVRRTFASMLAYDRKAYRSNPASRRMLENIEPNVVAQDPQALFVLFNGIASLDVADKLHNIHVPCHIFYGTHDPVVTVAQSLVLVKDIPGARPVAFEGVGHMPFIEAPDACFSALEQALKDIAESCSNDKDQGSKRG